MLVGGINVFWGFFYDNQSAMPGASQLTLLSGAEQ